MGLPIGSKTRLQMRKEIGYASDAVIVSSVSATKDTGSLWDDYGLARGGTDEFSGAQVIISAPSGSIVAGEKGFVSAFDPVNKDATILPDFTANLTEGDGYEMWLDPPGYTVEQVNNHINQAILAATDDFLVNKETHTTIKDENKYEYDCLSSFVGLHTVEYVYKVGVDHLLDNCEDAWTAGSSVTATADSAFEKVGTYCAKLVVASGAASGATLGYKDISSVDISDSDKVEFWMYSSIALTASQLQFMLGATAAIASPLETINIPAMTAATWYRYSLSLANPHSDTAIISIGVRQASGTDVGACTLYIDEVDAVLDKSKLYKQLSPDNWSIVQAATPLLKIDAVAYGAITNGRHLRLTGYQIPAELSDDTTACTIDPDFVVAKATSTLLMAGAKSREMDPEDRFRRASFWAGIAEKRLLESRTPLAMNTRFVG